MKGCISYYFRFSLLVICFSLTTAVHSDVLPGSVLPEQVAKSLTPRQGPIQGTAISPPILKEPIPKSGLGGPEAKKIKFKLNGIILQGNHVYSDEELSRLYRNKLGKVISVAELFGIIQAITNFYRNNGFIISKAILPPQHVKNGIVKVQVIEGFIDNVRVEGKPVRAKCIVLVYGNKIKEFAPLQMAHMEKYLLIENEIPGTQVKAVLSPSKHKPGASDLNLVTVNAPIMAYFSYDNYGTRYIGPQQVTANLIFNSLFTSGDTIHGTMTKTPKGSELSFIDVNYAMPVGDEGKRILIGGTRAGTHPLFVLQPLDIDGLNENFYAGLSIPVIRKISETLTFLFNFNYLDTRVTTQNNIELYTDHLRNVGIGASYNFVDRFKGANSFYMDIRQGLPILGYSSNTSISAHTSHPGGRANYSKIDLQANRLQGLWSHFSLYGQMRGQWSANVLLASEQFTFGGSQLGRGYDVAEIIGDQGLAGSIELRYDFYFKTLLQSLQPYIFYDMGVIWNSKWVFGTPMKASATSTGIGARFYLTRYLSGNVMWTQVLTKQVNAEAMIGEGRRPRLFFSIVASFA